MREFIVPLHINLKVVCKYFIYVLYNLHIYTKACTYVYGKVMHTMCRYVLLYNAYYALSYKHKVRLRAGILCNGIQSTESE